MQTVCWADTEFGHAQLGDPRRTARLVKIAIARAQRPSTSLPQCFESEAELDAIYDFCDNQHVDHEAILESHYQATQGRIKEHPVVLAHQDTSYVNYTHHPETTNLGILHDPNHQGLLLHPTLVTTPERIPLGLIDQQILYRDPADYGKKHQRKQRPIEEKESVKWLNSLEATAQVQAACPETLLVNVGDREADVYDVFYRAQKLNQAILVRAAWNRAVEHEEKYLWEAVESCPTDKQQLTADVPRSQARRSREAQLTVRYCKVTLKPPAHRRKETLPPITVWAVLVREESPPKGEKAIEWLLLTSVPITCFADVVERVQWYACRWMIEIYFKVLKSGCRIEERQFADAARIERYIAIDSVVAWRVLGLTYQSRETPDMCCEAFLEPDEWKALYCQIKQAQKPPRKAPSLREAARWIAELGGFLGRKRDGNPGVTVIWRGM